jgi:hypothetical protein
MAGESLLRSWGRLAPVGGVLGRLVAAAGAVRVRCLVGWGPPGGSTATLLSWLLLLLPLAPAGTSAAEALRACACAAAGAPCGAGSTDTAAAPAGAGPSYPRASGSSAEEGSAACWCTCAAGDSAWWMCRPGGWLAVSLAWLATAAAPAASAGPAVLPACSLASSSLHSCCGCCPAPASTASLSSCCWSANTSGCSWPAACILLLLLRWLLLLPRWSRLCRTSSSPGLPPEPRRPAPAPAAWPPAPAPAAAGGPLRCGCAAAAAAAARSRLLPSGPQRAASSCCSSPSRACAPPMNTPSRFLRRNAASASPSRWPCARRWCRQAAGCPVSRAPGERGAGQRQRSCHARTEVVACVGPAAWRRAPSPPAEGPGRRAASPPRRRRGQRRAAAPAPAPAAAASAAAAPAAAAAACGHPLLPLLLLLLGLQLARQRAPSGP